MDFKDSVILCSFSYLQKYEYNSYFCISAYECLVPFCAEITVTIFSRAGSVSTFTDNAIQMSSSILNSHIISKPSKSGNYLLPYVI